jgi:oxygen-independent coproporphyrinogen-3 oxidase
VWSYAEPEADTRVGVYVHFPYCLQKCPYCDFLSIPETRDNIPHAAYADAVLAELERRAVDLPDRRARSVFFGGGTPSLWEPRDLGRVLAGIRSLFDCGADLEVTVECNPSSFDRARAERLLEASVNRVSIGVQSLDAERLAFLGRLHDRDGALRAVREALAAGVPRVSADLIFGVSGQTAADARREVETVAELGLTHLSAYALTIEPGTRFGELSRQKRLPLLDEDIVAESFREVEAALEARGFEHYETSNYARLGHRSAHNLGYWRGAPYLGVGTGAFGTVPRGNDTLRYRNTPAIERYLALAADTSVALWSESALVSSVEKLDGKALFTERLMLGLRLAEGLDVARTARETGEDFWNPARERSVERLIDGGKLERRGDVLRVTKQGRLFADGVVLELL